MTAANLGRIYRGRRLCAAVSIFAVSLASVAMPASAAPTAEPVREIAQRNETRRYDIPAGPLAGALNAFADRSGLELVYGAALAQGLTAPGLVGEFTAEEGLKRLLAGSGIAWRFTSERAVTLERPGQGAITLDPITVEGQRRESAWGPVKGFVATRSATATKTDAPIIETPQAISVVTKEQMETRTPVSLDEVFQYTPGVTQPYATELRREWSQIRGFGNADGSSYRDGLKEQGTYLAEPYALERAEVLRGPASVLYGQSTPGGVFGLITKRPTDTKFGEVLGGYGSEDHKKGAFDIGGPVDDRKQILYRLTAMGDQRDLMTDFTTVERIFVAPAVTWKPTATTSLTFLTNYQRDNVDGKNSGGRYQYRNPAARPEIFVGELDFEAYDRRATALGYLFSHEFNDTWQVRHGARFNQTDLFRQFTAFSLQSNDRILNRTAWSTKERENAYAVDTHTQANWKSWGIDHTTVVGVDYLRYLRDYSAGSAAAPTLDILNPVYGQSFPTPAYTTQTDTTNDQIGAYVQDRIKFGRHWVLLLGGRHDWANNEVKNKLTGATTTDLEQAAFTWRGGLVYLFDNGLAPYANYAESFEPQTGSDKAGNAFEPTTGAQYEVGIRYEPPGMNGRITLSAFEITKQNVLTPDPANTQFNVQTGEVQSRGFEAEAVFGLATGLNLTAAYTLLDSKTTASNRANEVGQRFSGTPEHAASLWADYTVQGGTFAGLRFGGGLRYSSDRWYSFAATKIGESYVVADLLLGYAYRGMNFAVNVKNLFDNGYEAYCEASGCSIADGRTVLGTLAYRW